ncbi:MAG: prolyl oligopeptidase family serine peptidase [Pirellulales bacterium]
MLRRGPLGIVALGWVALILGGVAIAARGAAADPPRLIPRRNFFGNPDKAVAHISPDGGKLAFVAPVKGVLNIWVGPTDAPDQARPVTDDKKRGITRYFWSYDSRHILYMQDADGDENWHVYAIDLDSRRIIDLTPFPKVAAQIEGLSPEFPQEILVGLNNRDPQFHDIYRINIATGDRKLVEQNKGFAGYVCDDDYNVRFAMRYLPDGGTEYLRFVQDQGWVFFMRVPMQDSSTTSIAGFDKSMQRIYMIDSRGRDTGALKLLDLSTGDEKTLAANDKADIRNVILHPTEKTLEAVIFNYLRSEWQTFDAKLGADIEYLKTVAEGEIELADRSEDNQQWIVVFVHDDGPTQYYHFDRKARKASFLFDNRPALKTLPLVHMHPLEIKSRDGLDLVCYLSLPREVDPDQDGKPERPCPLVLNVHGGPWARDSWGYDPECQLLANRGYGVLQVNYRGSSGFGKSFLNAGNREWAAKMHDDLLDAVDWAVREKIADPQRIAIMGGSYGGYATLVGLTFTPDVFACGVDIVGPSNILTLLSTIPPYWSRSSRCFAIG